MKSIVHWAGRCAVLFAVLLAAVTPGDAYTDLYVFGDSFSDQGNLFAAIGFPLPPYVDGQFSNGPLYVERLAERLGLGPVLPASAGGTNFAWAGALAGIDDSLPPPFSAVSIASIRTQVAAFEARLGSEPADAEALYVVFGGHNDVFEALGSGFTDGAGQVSPTATAQVTAAAGQIVASVVALADRGAVHFLVPTMADLSQLPRVDNRGAAVELADAFNQTVDAGLGALAHLNIVRFDMDAMFEAVWGDFTFLTQPFLFLESLLYLTVTQDGAPVGGLTISLSRSISGLNTAAQWQGTTGETGEVAIDLAALPPGYYSARAIDPATGDVVGRWHSIPIRGDSPHALWLPVGGRMRMGFGRYADQFLFFDDIHPTAAFHALLADALADALIQAPAATRPVDAPEGLALLPAFPNPFNPATTIRYTLSEAADIRLTVHNVLGQQVRVLVTGPRPPGTHRVRWDGRDAFDRAVSAGMYLYRLEAGAQAVTGKVMLVK